MADAGGMPNEKLTLISPPQAARPLDAGQVLAQFKRASEQLFRRRLPAEAPTLRGLEVSESTWAEWERLINSDPR